MGDEVTPLELRETGSGVIRRCVVCGAETGDRAGPEDGADHRRVMRELLLLGLQPVEA